MAVQANGFPRSCLTARHSVPPTMNGARLLRRPGEVRGNRCFDLDEDHMRKTHLDKGARFDVQGEPRKLAPAMRSDMRHPDFIAC